MDLNEEKIDETQEQEKPSKSQKRSIFSRLKKKIQDRKDKKRKEIENQKLSAEETKVVEEKIEEVNKEVKSISSKKKKIRSIIFFVFNILLVAGLLLWNILSSDDFTPFDLLDLKYQYIFVSLVMVAVIVLIDVFTVHRMIYHKTMRSRWALAYKASGILRYYDAVTPMSSGGQPFMATYLMSRDIPGAVALSIPIAKLVFQQIAWLIVTFICLMISLPKGLLNTGVLTTSIIGFILVLLVVLFILTISFSKKFGEKIVGGGVKLLQKLHIIKDYDKWYGKAMGFVENYQYTMKEYNKAKPDVFFQLLMHALRYVCLFSIPFFIYCGFKGWQPDKFGEFFLFTAMIDLSSSFIPLPGGTGMNEITFTALFYKYLGGATFWALLAWRFCSYYFYLLQGIGLLTYDTVYGNKKYKWVQKRYELQNESQEFKRVQIENFRKMRATRRKNQKKNKNQE